MLEGLRVSVAWECLEILPEKREEVYMDREVWASLVKLLPQRPDPRTDNKAGIKKNWTVPSSIEQCRLSLRIKIKSSKEP